jgi:hypothetical protein
VRLLNKATAKNPDERFQSIPEMLGALEIVGEDDYSAETVVLGDTAVASSASVTPAPSAQGAAPLRRPEPAPEKKKRRLGWLWLILVLAVLSVGGYYGYQWYDQNYGSARPVESLTRADALTIVQRVVNDYTEYARDDNPDALALLYAPDSVQYFRFASASRDQIRADSRSFYSRIIGTNRLDVEIRRVKVVNDSTIDTEWIIYYERLRDDDVILRGKTSNAVRLEYVDREWLITAQKSLWLKPDNVEPEPEDSLEVIDVEPIDSLREVEPDSSLLVVPNPQPPPPVRQPDTSRTEPRVRDVTPEDRASD